MSFQKTVLIIAIVIFIILMLLIGVMINNAKETHQFPPQISQCPDYWIIDSDGNCSNTKKLGNGCKEGKNFPVMKTLAEKCAFASGCGIEWDGVTNSSHCN